MYIMLNIKPKKEAVQVAQENLSRFTIVKKRIIEESLVRDGSIITSEIFSELRHLIALTKYFRDIEWFHFTLPLINFDEYVLTQEEKEAIVHSYYHQKETLWIPNGYGEESYASLVKKFFSDYLQTNVLFKTCDINWDTNTVDFSFRMLSKMEKLQVKEEQTLISATFDEYLVPHLNFYKIADEINQCYETLTEEGLFSVYANDLDIYPVLSLNVEEILNKTDFYSKTSLLDEKVKVDINFYVRQSKLIKSLERKMRNYGYLLQVEATNPKNESFRSNGILLKINANYTSKKTKDTSLVKSETLREVFQQKLIKYNEVLSRQAFKQNEELIQLVEDGHFDAMITNKWVKATLMSTLKLTESQFQGERTIDELNFKFSVPFERHIPNLKEFTRIYRKVSGVGNRYMGIKDNIVDALKKRYPFFSNCNLFGDPDNDFQEKEDDFSWNSPRWKQNTLTFGFEADYVTYAKSKRNILEWLSSSYGTLNIDVILNNIHFNEDGVSRTIENFINSHSDGRKIAVETFRIDFATVQTEDIFKLYQNSPLYKKSKEMYEYEHENEMSINRRDYKYKTAKIKEFQALKMCNHFVHALLLHPMYNNLKEALQKLDYELKIEIKKEHKIKVDTDEKIITGADIYSDAYMYNVQLVIN